MIRLGFLCLWTLAASLGLTIFEPGVGLAVGRRPALHWTRGRGAATCIDPSTLAARVELLTGPVFVGPRAADYTIEAHIEARAKGGFVMRLSVSGLDGAPHGERMIAHDDSDCRGFDSTIVFVIALTVDPDLTLEDALPESDLTNQPPADVLLKELTDHPPVPVVRAAPLARASALTVRAPPSAKKTEPTKLAWGLSLGPVTSSGELPAQSLGAVLGVTAPVTSWFSLAAQLRFTSTIRPMRLDGDYRLRAQAVAGALLACARTPVTRVVVLTACLGPEPSVVRARGFEFATSRSAYLGLWGALARLELGYEIAPRWELVAQGFVRANLEHKRLVYSAPGGPQSVHEFGPIAGGMAICLIRYFGSGSTAARGTDVRIPKERTQ